MTSTRNLLHLAYNALSRAMEISEKKELKVNDLRVAHENSMIAAQTFKNLEIRLAEKIALQPARVDNLVGGLPPKTGDL